MKKNKCELGGQLGSQQDPQQDILKKVAKIGLPIAGMAIGSAIAPGAGTTIGGAIGGGIGSLFAQGGDLNEVYGLSHEDGGVQLGNSNNEVEEGEYIKDSKVLSKRLGYADRMKKLESKVKPTLRGNSDKLDKELLDKKFNELYNEQEEEKFYDNANSAFEGLEQFAKGGSIHINPENKGKFNATKARTGKSTEELTHSKNPLTRKRAVFALNASRWKHTMGGLLKMHDGGGKFDPPTLNESLDKNPYIVEGNDELQSMYQKVLDDNERSMLLKTAREEANPLSTITPISAVNIPQEDKSLIDVTKPVPTNLVEDGKKPVRFNNKMNPLGPALQSLDPLYNLALGTLNKDYVNYKAPTLNRMNPAQANALIGANMNRVAAGTRNAIRNTANTQGNYLSNLAVSNASINQAIGNSIASNLMGYNQANNTITNQNIAGKADVYNRNLDANEMIRDSRKTALSSGLRSTGNIGAGISKTQQEYSADNLRNNVILDTAKSLYPNFELLPQEEKDKIVGMLINFKKG